MHATSSSLYVLLEKASRHGGSASSYAYWLNPCPSFSLEILYAAASRASPGMRPRQSTSASS